MLKAIIFDAYGTLFDTGTGSVEAAAEILAVCGRSDILPCDFYARWKKIHRAHTAMHEQFRTEEEIYHLDLKQLYKELNIDSDSDKDVEIMLARQGTRIPYPETKCVLEKLGKRLKLYVGSTTDTWPIENDIRNAGLTFDKVFTSESLKVYKPFPEFYNKILNETGLKAKEALFVGDSLIDDVMGPQNVGLKSCWVNRKAVDSGDYKPDYQINDLTELIDIAYSML